MLMQLFLLTKKRHCSPLVKKFRRVFVTKFMKTCVEIVIGQNWKCQTILAEAHSRTVRRVNWSPCGNYLSSASFDGTVAIWDRKSGQFECSATLEGHENEVKSASWSNSGNFIASCSRDKSVWIWDVDQEEEEFMCAAVLQGVSLSNY